MIQPIRELILEGTIMITQHRQDRATVEPLRRQTREVAENHAAQSGAQYVLDMLSELLAISELSGLDRLSDDIQNVLDRHNPGAY